jgi:hypothetical protein
VHTATSAPTPNPTRVTSRAHPNEPEPRTVRVLRVTPAPAPSCVRAAERWQEERSQNCGWTSGERQLRGGWWSSIPPEPTAFKVRLRAVGCHLLAYTCRPLRVRGPACGLYRGRPLVRVRVYTCSTRGSPHAASPHQKASTERGSTRELNCVGRVLGARCRHRQLSSWLPLTPCSPCVSAHWTSPSAATAAPHGQTQVQSTPAHSGA